MEDMMERRNDVTRSVLKLMRAMRRRPVQGQAFPPAVGRMLMTLREHDGAAPSELCEIMDVRPSSMSELLGRMEEHGLIKRECSETDSRATKVFLSDSGKEAVGRIETRFNEENAKLASCFTEEEAAEFCALCDKLSAYLETEVFGENRPNGRHGGPHGHHGAPRCHNGMPHAPHHGAPRCHHGMPHGAPRCHNGMPHAPHGAPRCHHGMPRAPFCAPHFIPGMPHAPYGAPHFNPGMPRAPFCAPHFIPGMPHAPFGAPRFCHGMPMQFRKI